MKVGLAWSDDKELSKLAQVRYAAESPVAFSFGRRGKAAAETRRDGFSLALPAFPNITDLSV